MSLRSLEQIFFLIYDFMTCNLVYLFAFDRLPIVCLRETPLGHFQALQINYMLNLDNFIGPILDLKKLLDRSHQDIKLGFLGIPLGT